MSVVNVATDFLATSRHDREDFFDVLENEAPYGDIKSFLELPKSSAVQMFRGLPDPNEAWLETWKTANAVVYARES